MCPTDSKEDGIGSVDAIVLNKLQAITWTNDGKNLLVPHSTRLEWVQMWIYSLRISNIYLQQLLIKTSIYCQPHQLKGKWVDDIHS